MKPGFGRIETNFRNNWISYWSSHKWVTENVSRTETRSITYNGGIIYVDASKADDTGNGLTPGTAKKTITAAYNIAVDGGILQLADGTYLMSAEAGGYLLLNTGTKGVLIRGNSSNNGAVILQQNTPSSTFTVRMRNCKECDFKDLTITSNQAHALISITEDYVYKNAIFNNCVLENTYVGAGYSYIVSKVATVVDNVTPMQYDFINCTLKHNAYLVIGLSGGLNNIFTFMNCNFILSATVFRIQNTYTGKVATYNCTFTQNSSQIIIQFGEDTAVPAANLGMIDFRSNIVTMTGTYTGHGVLFGRGTKTVYAVNNQIYLPAVTNASSIGLVIKTTSDNVGDSYFAGNYVVAPRAFYIKGGSKTTVKYNSFISNENTFACFGFTNHKNGADEALSRLNVVQHNKFSCYKYGIQNYPTAGESEDSLITLKTNNINYNYYCIVDKYSRDGNTDIEYTWSNKNSFWGVNTNDNKSRLVGNTQLPITLPS
ncbi:MAG TPA: hypothetical protein VK153_00580 [Candidatus Paceibacterota bacterium]|nr:hypothetical protein [Candidatus Paceibacterota bacterium]